MLRGSKSKFVNIASMFPAINVAGGFLYARYGQKKRTAPATKAVLSAFEDNIYESILSDTNIPEY